MANPSAKGTLNGGAGITFVVVATIAVAVAFVGAALTPYHSQLNDAAAIAVITGAAVGIERVIEAGWSAVAVFKNSWWPLTQVAAAINEVVDEVGTASGPSFATIKAYVDEAVKAGKIAEDDAAAIKAHLEQAQAQIDKFKGLAADDERLKMIVAAASQGVDGVLQISNDPKLKSVCQATLDSVTALQSLLGSVQDNPGKRLISLYVGAVLGLMVVFVVGLDLFKAAGGVNLNLLIFHGTLSFGVAMTGIIVGLGSGPTHEIIKIIQEFKQGLQAGSSRAPSTADSGQATSAAAAGQA